MSLFAHIINVIFLFEIEAKLHQDSSRKRSLGVSNEIRLKFALKVYVKLRRFISEIVYRYKYLQSIFDSNLSLTEISFHMVRNQVKSRIELLSCLGAKSLL